MIVSMKELTKINELLSQGWSFSHTIGDKQNFALLTKYRNGNEVIGLGGVEYATPVLSGGY